MQDEADGTDAALLAAYQRGDVEAFSRLVARHERRLWNFVRRFVSDAATAEDVLQETLLRVVRGAAEWRPDAKVSTWMYTIARNLCVDHARRAGARRAESLDGDVRGGDGQEIGVRRIDRIAGADRGAEAARFDREAAARIEAAVAQLPVEQREVFLMREVMELPFAEIARAVGASEPTVKSRMRYALERLREALQDLRDTGERAVVAGAEQTS
jgi:RNA polymerase sigma-70 factor (ECF subfamily)